MITIIESPKFIDIALGKQQTLKNEKYRIMRFLIFSKCSDGYLIYNTLTKKLILVSIEEYNILQNIPKENNYTYDKLIESYFLVPENFDENKCFEQLKSLFKMLDTDNSITSYIILPTTDCNARCFYCCEHGQKRIYMTSQTAIDTAKYIIKKSNGKKVSIMWFGGEPLCNIEAINIICDYLNSAGINFTSNIISNAYLFDEKVSTLAKNKWNIKSAQITLDGTEKIYNKSKAYIYKSNANPFETVIDNISILANKGIKVIVRLNMDLFNRDNLYLLVDYLYDKFKGNRNISIYARMLFDNTSKLQTQRTNEERKQLYEDFGKFEDYIDSKGMYHCQNLHSAFVINSCIGTNKHGTVIMPSGELGMCDLHTDSDLYGNIYDGVTNQKVIDDFLVYKPPVKNCNVCPLFPNCSRLKKCLYYTRDCEEYEQKRLIRQMQRYIVYTYEHWKTSNK